MTLDEQIARLQRGTTDIISVEDLKSKLAEGRPLRIKLGLDPTAKGVTLGWAVVLRKLREFQDLGHTACLVVGDFTAQVGDPTGKSKTRKQLTPEEVQANIDAIKPVLFKILDESKTEISHNNDWLGKMGFADVIRLASRYTVARILERDDFANRLAEGRPVAMHEILYPLCQGMDSVELMCDVEIGGNDQMFNCLVGRNLMGQYGQSPQVVLLCPLLVGTDGKEKMSQSLGNYIAITDEPNEMFGKTMSIPDDLIANWFELCTATPMAEVREMLAEGRNPRDAKVRLAKEIVTLYHSVGAAEAAERYFVETFSQKKQPVEAEEALIPSQVVEEGRIPLAVLIKELGLAPSNGQARKLMQSGAVSLDEEKVSDGFASFALEELEGRVLRVGKHQFRRLKA